MLKLVYSLLTLPYSQSVEVRQPYDDMNIMTFEDLQLEGPDGNKREVLNILKKLNKVDMVSNIATFNTKAIKFDEVVSQTKKLIEKKDSDLAEELWAKIIELSSHDGENIPRNEHESLYYEDRREFFHSLTENLSNIHDLRAAVKGARSDGNDTTDWQQDQMKLNNLILATDMTIDQIDDSLLEKKRYIEMISRNVAEKDLFKAAMNYQEIVKQRYQTFFLEFFADYDMNQKKVSDGAFKMAHDFNEDITAYSNLAKNYPTQKDKKCMPLPIWPEAVLAYCDENAERFGYGDIELEYCKCYNSETKMLTRRKPKTKGKGDGIENYVTIDFTSGVAPKEELEDVPKRAMMDLGATYKQSSAYNADWQKPRLDSKTGFHASKANQNNPTWLEVDMPGGEFYEISAMSLMKRGDHIQRLKNQYLSAVQFQFSYDEGKNWHTHNDGKWYQTNLTVTSDFKAGAEIIIDPPMHGNAFRILSDKDHRSIVCSGRFDLWALKTPDFKPEDLKPEAKKAIMDLEATVTADHVWDKQWGNARLDSKTGLWNGKGKDYQSQWWVIDLQGDDFYEATEMVIKPRGDQKDTNRAINAVQFEYSYDNGKTWMSHNNGKWYNTSAKTSDNVNTERLVNIDPPMNGNAFKILVDHHDNHITGRSTVARFDLMVTANPDFKPVEGAEKPMPKRAMMDLDAKFTAATNWPEKKWNNPRLDSKLATWSKKPSDSSPQWWQVTLPGQGFYECSAMTLMKRGDVLQTNRVINAISFQFSQDEGKTWHDYENGKWIPTGQLPNDPYSLERVIKFEPPMNGNAFRAVMNHQDKHVVGSSTNGRFDFWVLPNPDFKPEELKPVPKRAMMDLGAKFTAATNWPEKKWNNPRLDSKLATWSQKPSDSSPQWWQVAIPGQVIYECSAMTLMKRGDALQPNRVINAISFQFSQDEGKTWNDYENGKWIPTGQLPNDPVSQERVIKFEPPMNGNAFRAVMNHEDKHVVGSSTNGRFDFWVLPNPEFKPEELKSEPQRAMMDLGATFSQSSAWSAAWRKPRLDSKSGFHNKAGQGNNQFWLQLDMPEDENYEVSEMSIMKRADGCCGNQHRQIDAFQFQTSQDGKSWYPHNAGKWYKTGQVWNDDVQLERKFKIEPPMNGKFFRIITDKEHKTGPEIQGRFDLWAVKNSDYEAPIMKPVAQRAMMDLGGTFKASSYWSKGWMNPRLDSKTGVHNAKGQGSVEQWWEVDLPGEGFYEASAMTLMKRGDGADPPRTILAVQFQFSQDNGKTWHDHEDGKWFETGALPADNRDVARKFAIEPPMSGNAFRVVIDAAHKSGSQIQGRFDLWVVKNDEYKVKTDLEVEPQRAMMDLGATYKQSSKWSAAWEKPRLDSRSGFHNARGQGNSQMWLQVDMPEDINYQVSEMSLMKRADGCCGNQHRQIDAVSFETSQDGKNWMIHNEGEGQWYQTGQVWNDKVELERRIKIEPPMNGKFFRVILDQDHKTGPEIQGRFDLWAVKNPDFVPPAFKARPQRAMIDLGATTTQSSQWSAGWAKPRLDSRTGFHNVKGQGNNLMWIQVNMPGEVNYEVNEMSFMKRADGCCGNQHRQIDAFKFETSQDGKTWKTHNEGEGQWYKTGQVWNDAPTLVRKIKIEPPMNGRFFRVLTDKDHKTGPEIQGRFDLWAVPNPDFKEGEEDEGEEKEAIVVPKGDIKLTGQTFAAGDTVTVKTAPATLGRRFTINFKRSDKGTAVPLHIDFRGKSFGNVLVINEKNPGWAKELRHYPKKGLIDDYFKEGAIIEIKLKEKGADVFINGVQFVAGATFKKTGGVAGSYTYNKALDYNTIDGVTAAASGLKIVKSIVVTKGGETESEEVGGLVIGKCYQFSSKNFPANAFRHRNNELWLDEKENDNDLYKADSTWKVIKGNSGDEDSISLEATNYPEFHVRHANWLGFANEGEGELYNKDSTFKVVQNGSTVQFESVNFPNHMLRHANFRLRLSKNDGSGLFTNDSNFTPQEMEC